MARRSSGVKISKRPIRRPPLRTGRQAITKAVYSANPSAAETSAAASIFNETSYFFTDFTDDFFSNTGQYGSSFVVNAGTIQYDSHPYGLLSYISPSMKMVRGPNGLLRYGAHNFFLNSDTPADQSMTVVLGATYAINISGSVSVTLSGAATGTYTAGLHYITATTTTLTFGSVSGAGSVQLSRFPCDNTYLPTAGSRRFALPIEWAYDGSIKGVLVESAMTNLNTRSQEFDDAVYSKTNTTVSSNATTAPDGTITADLLLETTANGSHTIRRTGHMANSTLYTVSLFVKAAGRTVCTLLMNDGASSSSAHVDLSLGTITQSLTALGSGCQIEPYADGWYRISITGTTLTGGAAYWDIRLSDNTDVSGLPGVGDSYTGDASLGMYIWGAQTEGHAFMTSYMPTLSATEARVIDVIRLDLASIPFNAAEGTLYVSALGQPVNSTYVALQFADGTENERFRLTRNTTPDATMTVTDGGVLQANASLGTWALNTAGKIVFGYKVNDFGGSFNGGATVTDVAGTIPTVTTMYIGSQVTGAAWRGHIQKIGYIARKLSSAEIQAL